MFIRIKKNGVYSDWFQNTKKIHRSLLTDPPETVQIWLDEVYPGSPDSTEPTEVPFEVFNTITREAVLEENRYLKRLARYHDARPFDEILKLIDTSITSNVEEEYIRQESKKKLQIIISELSDSQLRRLKMRIVDKMTYREIAAREGISWHSVQDSINLIKILANIILFCDP